MNNGEEQINLLFDSIKYGSHEQLDLFILNLSKEQSLYVVTEALEMGHRRGVYSLQESEILSKSLRILNKEIYSVDDREGKK